MKKLCIFAGTTEGRQLTDLLRSQDAEVVVCVATEYGEELLEAAGNITVSARRLPQEEILELFRTEHFDLVIDATHPYAVDVTQNIKEACANASVRYIRLLRGASAGAADAVYVKDPKEAADYLSRTEGNILLTTGSKELETFAGIPDFADRVYARVLPMESSIEACRKAGLYPAHIIAMQGPFTEEINIALLNYLSAAWIVTKDGGSSGGFPEKEKAAQKTGTRMLVIGRPQEEDGLSFEETIRLLEEEYGFARSPLVTITGIGPGSKGGMTQEAAAAIRRADCLIGAKRMLASNSRPGQQTCEAVSPDSIVKYMEEHPEYRRFAVLMSGDSGFFSGTKKLLKTLDASSLNFRTEVLPGISSLSSLCAKVRVSYEDVLSVSLHGREHDIVPDVRTHKKVFVLVGGGGGINRLCRTLIDAGLGEVRLSVGERLSYPDEKITTGTAKELVSGTYDSLSAALIEHDNAAEPKAVPASGIKAGTTAAADRAAVESVSQPANEAASPANEAADAEAEAVSPANEPENAAAAIQEAAGSGDAESQPDAAAYEKIVTHGLPDEAFERGSKEQGMIPMTKSEIRSISLSRLQLTKDAVCWDIGAGTGSVAIEMARQATEGKVYAVEKEPEAVQLTKKNVKRLGASHITVVEGEAPEALKDLPAPTHVFIGGSAGNIREILRCILSKNPDTVIVATAVTLDTIAELTAITREEAFAGSEVAAVQVSKDRKAGHYRLMNAQNPVYIFTIRRSGR